MKNKVKRLRIQDLRPIVEEKRFVDDRSIDSSPPREKNSSQKREPLPH